MFDVFFEATYPLMFEHVTTLHYDSPVHVHVALHVFVGCYLATKVFIGKLLAVGCVWVIIGRLMMKGGHEPTK